MLSVQNITYLLGGRTLYHEASLYVKEKDKIALIGLNGTGKSTLLKLIYKNIIPDKGTIEKNKQCTIGFLNQDLLSLHYTSTIREYAMQAFKDVMQIQKKIDVTLVSMEKKCTSTLVNTLGTLQEKFENLGGYQIQAQSEAVLEGMGFATQDLDRNFNSFSGGERMRVILAKLLLEKPNILMLDEPTNHLDMPTILWLENYLKHYDGTLIIVSHDRKFLDHVTNKTIEIDQKKFYSYAGNYSYYLREKASKAEIQKKTYKNQQKKIQETNRFIERFKAKATKAKQVQSRIKALNKIEKIEDVDQQKSKIKLQLDIKIQPGKIPVKIEQIQKFFGDEIIFQKTSSNILRGDKIALIGANGKGKSTLLKIIHKKMPIESGRIDYGNNVDIQFFAQHQLEALNLNHNLFETLQSIATDKSETEIRKILGLFLFKKDDVFKKVKVLSGGEKARLALAKILLSQANILLMDEPTNHLDMISIDILAQALRQYKGTLVVVSHNRDFIAQFANKIWCIENYQIKSYPGTYQEYVYSQEQK